MAVLAASAPGTGGAPLWQLAVLALVYWGGSAVIAWLVLAHRSGRSRVLERAGNAAGWVFALPGWSALPVLVAAVGLILAMWAGAWDIGYHIDHGRDAGPLGNPAHVPLLLGTFMAFAGGMLAIGMADPRDASPAWVRVTSTWRAPLGGVLLAGCMAFGVSGLVLDDAWHRIFGQDVTLWSPTHFIFLGGGILAVIGMLVLLKEGAIANRDARSEARSGFRLGPLFQRLQRAALLGGLLCGLELFLTEFDYGVPLYRQAWQPLLIAVFAGFVYTSARAWVGPGGALTAWLVYAVLRLTAVIAPVAAGLSPSSMPLLLAEAVCVELLALRLDARRRPSAFGAAAGLLCGTIGFAAEFGWSRLAMPLPWTGALLPEGAILATLGGLAGGILGALFALSLRGRLPAPAVARATCVGAFALLAALAVDAATKREPAVTAEFALTDVQPAPKREAMATVRVHPANGADDANWLYILAWQGRAPRVADRLTRVSEGVYRTNTPIPLYGSWKVGLRLNRGYERGAAPVRLPVDRGLPHSVQHIPAVVDRDQLAHALERSAGSELPAPAHFTRPFGDDGLIVLREAKRTVADWLWAVGIALVAAIWGLFGVTLAFGLGRMGRATSAPLVRRSDAGYEPAMR